MKQIVIVIAGFVIISFLAYLGIAFVSTIPEPFDTSSNEYEVYQNLSNTTEVAFTGQEAGILLLVVGMVFGCFITLFNWFA